MQYAIDDEPWETIHTPMPLRLGSLTIIDLGRIEFVKPRFHDTNYIWPVGFTSTRVYASLFASFAFVCADFESIVFAAVTMHCAAWVP